MDRTRFSELAALRRANLDVAAGTVTVTGTAVDLVGEARASGPPESEAGRRTVAIPPHILGDLLHHLATYAQPRPSGLVFVGPQGGPLRRNNFATKVWQPAARQRAFRRGHTCMTCADGAPPWPPGRARPPGN